MSEIEKTMEINPYGWLMDQPERDKPAEVRSKVAEEVEMIPVSDKTNYSLLKVRVPGQISYAEFDIEEDFLVPDTEPDCGMILNVSPAVDDVRLDISEESEALKGEIALEVLYHSADIYNDKLVVLKAKAPFRKNLGADFSDESDIRISCDILKTDYRIINERKYRVKITVRASIQEIRDCDRKFFEGIEGEELELMKEKTEILTHSFSKSSVTGVDETFTVDDEKIRPLKILKSTFCVAENHRQLTADRLVTNTSVWVRIVYVAELASQGNLSNQPMLFTCKIDNTNFIPLEGKGIEACQIKYNTCDLSAEINEHADGFTINGNLKADIDFYETVEKEVIIDFYNRNDEMEFDRTEENVLKRLEKKAVESTVRESIGVPVEHPEPQRIVYMDAHVEDVEIVRGNGEIKGKLYIEIITMTDGNQPALAKKVCDFIMSSDIGEEWMACGEKVFVREMDADISNQGLINVTVQLQAELELQQEGTLCTISNPCIVRKAGSQKQYPIILYTVKADDTLWDIAKRYRVPAAYISETNKIDTLREGMKIVIAK